MGRSTTARAAFTALNPPQWLADELGFYSAHFTAQQARVLVLFKDDLPHPPPARGLWQLSEAQKAERIEATRTLVHEQLEATITTTDSSPESFDSCIKDIALTRVANIACFNRFAGRCHKTMHAVIGLFNRESTGADISHLMFGHTASGLNTLTAQRCALGHEAGHFEDYYTRPGPQFSANHRELTADRKCQRSQQRHGHSEAAAMADMRVLANYLAPVLPSYQNSCALTLRRARPLPPGDETMAMGEILLRTELARDSLASASMPLSPACLTAVAAEISGNSLHSDCSLSPNPRDLAALRPLIKARAFSRPEAEMLAIRLYTAAVRRAPEWLKYA